MRAAAGAKRIPLIDAAKGLAILLVVVGHYFPKDSPEYWVLVHDVVYTFHMPVFFMLSGYLFFATMNRDADASLLRIAGAKLQRLGIPFLTIAALFFAIKFAAQFFVTLDHPVNLARFVQVFVSPVHSYMPLLWFMYSLFFMYLVVLAATRVAGRQPGALLLLLCSAVYVAAPQAPEYFMLGSTLRNLPFFLLGFVWAAHHDIAAFCTAHRKYAACAAALFVVFFMAFREVENAHLAQVGALLLGFSGIASVCLLSAYVTEHDSFGLVERMGYYSMSIYLFHTLFESAIRVSFYQLLRIDRAYFLAGAVPAIAAGVVLPSLLEGVLIRRNRMLRKAILGV